MIANALTLGVGAIGAVLAVWLGLPMPLITGPAICVALAGVAGLRLDAHPKLRDGVFLLLGVEIGAGITPEAVSAVATWPAAFVALPLVLLAMMTGGASVLRRGFGFDRRAALLAATPGHLSFVFALGESLGLRADRIVLVQAIRLLLLTLLVPFAAAALGIDTTATGPARAPMPLLHFGALLAAALLLSPVIARLRLPAALMLSGLFLSSLAHGSGVVSGGLIPELSTIARVIVGALLGVRFSGVTWAELRALALAGLSSTAVSAGVALGAALLLAPLVGFPVLHLLVALAPGGLQTMVIIGDTLGANPAFVAAMHVARLALLSAMIPLLVRRA